MRPHPFLQAIRSTFRYAVLPIIVIGGVVLTGLFFFWHGQAIMVDELKDRIRSTAALAATQIDPSLIVPLRTFSDTTRPQYKALVTQLDRMRGAIPNIQFAYIMRPTDDPLTLEFVADADGLATPEELDTNGNDIVDPDEEPGHPGDPYDVSATPALQNLTAPAVDESFTTDQWGTFISGYAPIRNAEGDVVAMLGIDMNAEEFSALSQRIFSPVALLLIAVAGIMMSAYVFIVVHQRRMESMKQLNTERTALMDLATHQLGAPLATFRWWVEILRDQAHKKDNDALVQLEEGIARMDDIIKSLRTAVHMQTTEIGYSETSVTIRSILSLLPESTAQLLRRRKQTLVLQVPASLRVKVDKKLFAGVLQELIENASWYSPEKAVITVRAQKKRRAVSLEVEDHGIGIPSDDFPHLFEQFRRGTNATKYKPVGNGLGLYIAKGIVEGAKGTLSAKSALGKGTTFTITLPLV